MTEMEPYSLRFLTFLDWYDALVLSVYGEAVLLSELTEFDGMGCA